MKRYLQTYIPGLVGLLMLVPNGWAQYIGYVYPAGGRQGTTFQVTLGGQKLDGINSAFVSGAGVKARLVEYNRKLGNQEIQLLNEQLKELKERAPEAKDQAITNLMTRLGKLIRDNVNQPACASIANLAVMEVTIDPQASPGAREIRIGTSRGVSNPLVFMVGQLPEYSRPPMPTCPLVTLGKEAQSVRRRKRDGGQSGGVEMMMAPGMTMGGPGAQEVSDEGEARVGIPCVVNGQISQGAIDWYRFEARKGQRLVITAQARELIPFVADAVPGWFQPVLVLCDVNGRELAYGDDYRFKPDPAILYEVPADGEYRVAIYDAIYRGREDFVYRISMGELPFVTSIFPLGACVASDAKVELKGWNLAETTVTPDLKKQGAGHISITARSPAGLQASPIPFAVTELPECLEIEPNSMAKTAQRVTLPVIVNGRIDKPGKKDVFQFEGQAGQVVVADVMARRLESPLDSVLKITGAAGKTLAVNDDFEDAAAGINTHHADSYIRATLPSNGTYFIYLNDAQHRAGVEYAYRLRISAPQPDFALRAVPSYLNIRGQGSSQINIIAIRQDGFTNAISFQVKTPTNAFKASGSLSGTQEMVRVSVRTTLRETPQPVSLLLVGTAKVGDREISREVVPAEDRMQAFLWRHLVPAQELTVLVFDPPPKDKK